MSNARLAVLLLMGTSCMLFASLLSALVILRGSSLAWPPPGQPYLPLAVTLLNTAVLLASAVTMRRAVTSVHGGDDAALRSWLRWTGLLGSTFLAVQGFEWARLVRHGLTLSSSTYGATFYSLIGLHAAHVVAAVLWLLYVAWAAWRGRYSARKHVGVSACAMYWYFVCGVWLVLLGAVYLR